MKIGDRYREIKNEEHVPARMQMSNKPGFAFDVIVGSSGAKAKRANKRLGTRSYSYRNEEEANLRSRAGLLIRTGFEAGKGAVVAYAGSEVLSNGLSGTGSSIKAELTGAALVAGAISLKKAPERIRRRIAIRREVKHSLRAANEMVGIELDDDQKATRRSELAREYPTAVHIASNLKAQAVTGEAKE